MADDKEKALDVEKLLKNKLKTLSIDNVILLFLSYVLQTY